MTNTELGTTNTPLPPDDVVISPPKSVPIIWTSDRLNLIRDFLKEKKSLVWIAHELGIKKNNLLQVMYKYGIKARELNPDFKTGSVARLRRGVEDLSVAQRLAQLQGLVPLDNKDKVYFFPDDTLKTWLTSDDPVVAMSKDLWADTFLDYQQEMVKLFQTKKRVIVSAGRQTGKDWVASRFAVCQAIKQPNCKILIVSPSERQSQLLYGSILQLIAKNAQLFSSVKKSSMESLELTNGSLIVPLPSTSYIRGFTEVNFIIVNECAYLAQPEQTFAGIEPMLAVRNKVTGEYGTLILMSSPNGCTGKFWEYWNDALFCKLHVPTTRNKYVSQTWLAEQKQLMAPVIYQAEILGEFTETQNNFFPEAIIQKCVQSYDFQQFGEELKYYSVGIDWGRYVDSSVLCVVELAEGDVKRVVNLVELQGIELSQQVKQFEALSRRYNLSVVIAERAGLSIQACEELRKAGLPVEEFVPTIDTKMEAYTFALREMEAGRVVLPKHDKLLFQLRHLRFELSSTGKLKLHHSSESVGDDFCDSFVMGLWGATRQGFGLPFFAMK